LKDLKFTLRRADFESADRSKSAELDAEEILQNYRLISVNTARAAGREDATLGRDCDPESSKDLQWALNRHGDPMIRETLTQHYMSGYNEVS
jgi:hypothetical protein